MHANEVLGVTERNEGVPRTELSSWLRRWKNGARRAAFTGRRVSLRHSERT